MVSEGCRVGSRSDVDPDLRDGGRLQSLRVEEEKLPLDRHLTSNSDRISPSVKWEIGTSTVICGRGTGGDPPSSVTLTRMESNPFVPPLSFSWVILESVSFPLEVETELHCGPWVLVVVGSWYRGSGVP